MSVQDDKGTDQADQTDQAGQEDEQRLTEKPEPDEDDKKEAAKMMEAYEDKPTIVLPGTGGSVSGTAVNEWLDEDGNPKHETPEGADESKSDDSKRDEKALQEQIEKDKALNEQLRQAAEEENKGEKG
ncbi:hypothetical protein [Mycobacterium mantenii]|uniref:Uncharacterized protein n=1 Tax=Mycobacterium mantenii TaxID=560555 RepID=A0A1A2T6A6_MYCNT|nr:hypothetical protein [Mycobacterium mantenii]OBH48960.1 hypothetical protein A5688_23380 [Mycobacterium mantenii]OBH69372.1 hypothetical protein A5683_05045 [Mycobacterium mantenii]OBH71567.1 hypothetical protein A5682_07715 [Mycobacterium mantenii]